LDKSFYGDRHTDDTEANTIARPLYLFFTIVIIKEGRARNQGKRGKEKKEKRNMKGLQKREKGRRDRTKGRENYCTYSLF
jgi:hypothetical protein